MDIEGEEKKKFNVDDIKDSKFNKK